MRRLTFSESKKFFNELDKAVEEARQTIISFAGKRPGENSKLRPRLKHYKNWHKPEQEFKKLQAQILLRL